MNFMVWLPGTFGDTEPCGVWLFSSTSELRVAAAADDHGTSFDFLLWFLFRAQPSCLCAVAL